MNLKSPLACALLVVSVALTVTACGGGDDDGGVVVANPAAFTKTDTVLGTGAEAVSGKTATITYSGWLYSATAADHKSTQFDAGTLSYVVGSTQLIAGVDQGVQGMKVGGKRTVLVPSNLAYGSAGSSPKIPPNAGLVFEIALTAVK